jgi:hypothetical protein
VGKNRDKLKVNTLKTCSVEECIAVTKEEMEKPSDVLVSEALGNFFVHADASVGLNMGELEDA